jgi:hypothetical protein
MHLFIFLLFLLYTNKNIAKNNLKNTAKNILKNNNFYIIKQNLI